MYYRKCPKCNEEIPYKRKITINKAEKQNTDCKSCAKKGKKRKPFTEETRKRMSENHADVSGENNVMFGRCAHDIWVEKHGKEEADKKRNDANNKKRENHYWTGRKRSEETRKRMSESLRGRKLTDEHRKNCRLSAIKRIKKTKGQIQPNYNPNAIPIILQEAKELGITDLQHAENGGEYQVCGYFVDGFSKEKNIVIEYYEPFHKNQVERDERRKNEIIKGLGCGFIEISEKINE
jgi:hypothetical protein